jgi:hypothetical protein
MTGAAFFLVIIVSAAIVWQQGYLNRWLFASLSDEEKLCSLHWPIRSC